MIRTQICRFSYFGFFPMSVISYHLCVVKGSPSCSLASLSSPKVKACKVQEVMKAHEHKGHDMYQSDKGASCKEQTLFSSRWEEIINAPYQLTWSGVEKGECGLWNNLIRQNGHDENILDIAYILLLTFQDTVTALCQLLPSLHWQAWWVLSTRIFQMHGREK